MKVTGLLVAVIVMAMATRAQAVQLTVMNVATNATNSIIPAGEQVVTFGIQVRSADLIGAGTDPVLFVHRFTFAGNGVVPINGSNGATNKVDVQAVQAGVIDPVAEENGAPVGQSDLSSQMQTALYADSWWYNGNTGIHQGVDDSDGDFGILTDPAWQTGPVKYIGSTGYQWFPNATGGVEAGSTVAAAVASPSGTNATTGQYMMYSGLYGPNGPTASNSLTGSPLAGQFVNGLLTVPLAQIVTTGDITFPGTYSNAADGLPGAPGTGTFIGIAGVGVSNGPTGNGTYNALGGNPNTDPSLSAYYSFTQQRIVVTPEPSSFLLLWIGAVGPAARRAAGCEVNARRTSISGCWLPLAAMRGRTEVVFYHKPTSNPRSRQTNISQVVPFSALVTATSNR